MKTGELIYETRILVRRGPNREITEYASVSAAAKAVCKEFGTGKFRKKHSTVCGLISRAALGKAKTAYGSTWEYWWKGEPRPGSTEPQPHFPIDFDIPEGLW